MSEVPLYESRWPFTRMRLLVSERYSRKCVSGILLQGYLAHKKMPTPLGPF